jgi:voltage-gated potassium channel
VRIVGDEAARRGKPAKRAPLIESAEHGAAVRRSAIRCVVVVVALFTAFAFLPFRGSEWWVGALLGAGLLAMTVPLALSRLGKVLTSDRPGFEAAEALIQLVAMLVTGFAAVLYAMNRDGTQITGLDTRMDAVYFTVTTLSTVGYGDIHASSQWARFVVTVQIAFNLLFVGVAVRVFIGAAKRRVGERTTTPPDPS